MKGPGRGCGSATRPTPPYWTLMPGSTLLLSLVLWGRGMAMPEASLPVPALGVEPQARPCTCPVSLGGGASPAGLECTVPPNSDRGGGGEAYTGGAGSEPRAQAS